MRAPFIALVALLAAVAPLALGAELPAGATSRERRGLRALLARRAVRASLLSGLAFYLTVGVFEATWAILLADRGASQLYIGATLSLFSAPMLVVAPFGGRLAQRARPAVGDGTSLGTAAVCMPAYGAIPDLTLLAAVLVVHSIADAFTMPALQLAIARASPPDQIASGQGLLGAAGSQPPPLPPRSPAGCTARGARSRSIRLRRADDRAARRRVDARGGAAVCGGGSRRRIGQRVGDHVVAERRADADVAAGRDDDELLPVAREACT